MRARASSASPSDVTYASVVGSRSRAARRPPPLGGDTAPALGRELLHVAVAEHDAKAEPDGAADDFGWELVQSGGSRLRGPCPTPTQADLPTTWRLNLPCPTPAQARLPPLRLVTQVASLQTCSSEVIGEASQLSLVIIHVIF
jgi:hypothetical protein